MTPIDLIVGNRIRECREKMGITQDVLAEILRDKYGLKTSRSTLAKWETGFQLPTMQPLKCLAEIFEESLDYLNGSDDATRNGAHNKMTRQSLKDDEKILLGLWGDIGDEERAFFKKQLERAAEERRNTYND